MLPMLDFAELKTPAGHGETLVMPSPDRLVDLVQANRRLLETYEFPVLDLSSLDCRRLARQRLHAPGRESPWIVTGHQPEFIHPGVWAKHVVTQRLADRVGGVAVNLIVDHDAAKDVSLAVPSEQDGRLRTVHVPFAPYRPGMPWESVPPVSKAQLDEFAAAVRAACGPRYNGSLMGIFFAAAAEAVDPHDWVDQAVAGRRAIDAMFGIRLHETRARQVWGGPVLAAMLLDADRFVDCYNGALQDYRRMLGIKGSIHPIPDMIRQGDRLELPVWAVRPGLPRQRVFCRHGTDRVELLAERDPIGTLSVSDLRSWQTAQPALEHGIAAGIRPRALTLTFWARLFLADLFIHGIGGAKYDRITDLLIRRYCRIEPPGICGISATLRLDLPTHPVGPKDLRDLRRRIRDLRFNPQRSLPPLPQVESLLAAKSDLVTRSNWLRDHQPDDRFERRDVFNEIHSINERMLGLQPARLADLQEQRQSMRRRLADNAVARSREYFIGLFRRQDLQFLCDMLPTFGTPDD